MSNEWKTLSQELEEFEQAEFGTNDFREIVDIVQERERQRTQDLLTGMNEEQAEWERDW